MFDVGLHERVAEADKINGVGWKAYLAASPKAMYVLGPAHPRSVLVARMTILTPQQQPVPVLHVESVAAQFQRRVEMQPGV